MTSKGKAFDAVATVREIRDRISAEIAGMTLDQQLEWMAAQPLGDPLLERLRRKAAEKQHAADGTARRD